MAYNSKYTGHEVEQLLDQVANGNTGGGGTQVQADWQESNKSNPSFIKNKPNIWQEYENGEPTGSIKFNSPISVTSFNFQTPFDADAGNILFDESGIHYSAYVIFGNLKTIDIIHTGDGTKFLADDGTYKEVSGGGGGGITSESDPIFSASPAATITEEKIAEWNGKQDLISDIDAIRSGASKGASAATTTYVDQAIANAITNTLNTPV